MTVPWSHPPPRVKNPIDLNRGWIRPLIWFQLKPLANCNSKASACRNIVQPPHKTFTYSAAYWPSGTFKMWTEFKQILMQPMSFPRTVWLQLQLWVILLVFTLSPLQYLSSSMAQAIFKLFTRVLMYCAVPPQLFPHGSVKALPPNSAGIFRTM